MKFSSSVTVKCNYDYATKEYTLFPDQINMIKVSSDYNVIMTESEAAALVALFPKYVKVKVGQIRGINKDGSLNYFVVFSVNLNPDGTTGAVNESAIKRVRALVKACDANGIKLEVEMAFRNSVARDLHTI
jgi:hypothetical protein